MRLKDLTVLVDTGRGSPARVALAIELARRHDAHLAAVHILPSPDIPAYVDAAVVETSIRRHDRKVATEAARLGEEFGEAARRQGVHGEWRVVRDFYDEGEVQARYADVVIVGQPDPGSRSRLTMSGVRPEDLALGGGRPVLVVPYAGRFETVGRNVLVAWKPSREATRAVNDAIPVIEAADQVTVLVVKTAGAQRYGEEPGAGIALHLARHGIKASVEQTVAVGRSVADAVLSRVAELGCDLVVMGAYGHSRLRELVLGGVTRDILRHMTVPVLMSH
jgi:nucleotide-binding universal stress UspA family protein